MLALDGYQILAQLDQCLNYYFLYDILYTLSDVTIEMFPKRKFLHLDFEKVSHGKSIFGIVLKRTNLWIYSKFHPEYMVIS